ncbi:sigma factor-like helix-turn-helix DNA-binding protein [Streptomyces sp. NPDC048604]|uniref:sigma factor-like helix-turn-helix DNA-binding protein n=1 Tax=Streptomyces sp. NPDC048604 TaxID=3365578 RepID=UPI003716B516
MSQGTAPSSSGSLPSPKERRRLREAKALTEDQVAEAVGVTRATVRSWETGRSSPRGRKRDAYVRLLGVEAPEPPKRARKTPTRPATHPRTSPPAAQPEEAVVRAPEPVRAETEPEPVQAAAPAPAPEVVAALEAAAGAPEAPQTPERPAAPRTPEEPSPVLTPEGAFDDLYVYAAPGLVHQTYLLTGRRRLSREAVERAFHHAWQHWPRVAVDRDPVGWVRAAAYEYALSPWHRLRRAHRHPDAPPTEAGRRAILEALLELPPPYRRTVLLYDGLGLDLPETAAETEASTPAAANRLIYARESIGRRIPELADPDVLHETLRTLVAEAPTVSLAPAHSVRTGSERHTRLLTRSTFILTAAVVGATAFTLHTAPTEYLPEVAPGQAVEGVPLRGGPEQLNAEDEQLRDALRSQPHHGPERLVPLSH